MRRKMLFIRNGGTTVVVSSIEDIKRSLENLMQGFDDIEIDGNHVLARIDMHYIK